MKRDFDTIASRVAMICKENPSCIKNYNKLLVTYWSKHDPEFTTSAESITRCFRKLVEKGVIEITKEHEESRKKATEEYIDYFANGKD